MDDKTDSSRGRPRVRHKREIVVSSSPPNTRSSKKHKIDNHEQSVKPSIKSKVTKSDNATNNKRDKPAGSAEPAIKHRHIEDNKSMYRWGIVEKEKGASTNRDDSLKMTFKKVPKTPTIKQRANSLSKIRGLQNNGNNKDANKIKENHNPSNKGAEEGDKKKKGEVLFWLDHNLFVEREMREIH